MLEYAWTLDSPKLAELPIWAKHNQYVQSHIPEHDSISRSASALVKCVDSSDSDLRSHSSRTPPSLNAQLGHCAQLPSETYEPKASNPRFKPTKLAKGRKKKSTTIITKGSARITKILRGDAPPAMGTRSRNISKFYELDQDKTARTLRKP